MGVSGIDLDGTLLDFDFHEVRVKQAIMKNSRHVLLAVDQSKYGRTAMVKLGDISQIDLFFSDLMPPDSLLEILKRNDTPIEICSNEQ